MTGSDLKNFRMQLSLWHVTQIKVWTQCRSSCSLASSDV